MKTVCNTTVPFGDFKVLLRPNGTIVIPDLTEHWLPVLQQAGADPRLWEKSDCAIKSPKLKRSRHRLGELIGEVKQRMEPCQLCERRCNVNRLSGEVGFCGLDYRIRLFASSNLYNEGKHVGSPTFGVFLSGCALRCRTCYRPENWNTGVGTLITPQYLAALLDDVAENGSRSWMFLGGNPDQSVLGILETLQHTKSDMPVVWNTAMWSTPEPLSILREIIDIWIIDFKFGNNECAKQESSVSDYVDVITRNLDLLKNEAFVIVRHGIQEGHLECCTMPIKNQVSRMEQVVYLEHDIVDCG